MTKSGTWECPAGIPLRGLKRSSPFRTLGAVNEDSWQEAATIVRGWIGTAARLREQHVPGPDGRCRGCTSAVRPAPHWPCGIALLVGSVLPGAR
jgi:hypothetical protein